MGHGKLPNMIFFKYEKLEYFIVKKLDMKWGFFVYRTQKSEYINEYGSASKFPSMGQGSWVRVNYKQLQFIQVPEYGSIFPSTGQGMEFEKNSGKSPNF